MPGSAGPRHGFVWGYSAGETGWGLGGFNPNFAKLEALLHLSVTSITSTPPGTPAAGMVYIVGGSPSGAWVGHAGAVAAYYTTGWVFIVPVTGVRAWNVATSTYWRYSGSAWTEEPAAGDVSGPGGAVAGAVPVYADATGKLLADSGIDFGDLLQIGAPLVPANFIAVDGVGRAIDSGVSIGGLGTGDVTGPAGSVTAGNLASYADTTGELLADSLVPVADLILAGGALVAGNLVTVDGSGDLVDTGIAAGDTGASVTVADTAPSSPATGDLWWDSSGGQLYVFFDSYWVAATNLPGSPGWAGGPIHADDYIYFGGATGTVNAAGGSFIYGDGDYLIAHTGASGSFLVQNAAGDTSLTIGQTHKATFVGVVAVSGNGNPMLEVLSAYSVFYSPTGGGLQSCIAAGGTSDPTNYYRNTHHSFADTTGASVVLVMNAGSQNFGGGGVVVGAPTGGAKGTGTLNAVTVYGNNVVLTSDARLKEDVELLPPCLDLVRSIEPVAYYWKPLPEPEPVPGPEGKMMRLAGEMPQDFTQRQNWGFLAQDVAVATGAYRNDGGIESVDVGGLIATLWKAVKELAAEVDELKGARR